MIGRRRDERRIRGVTRRMQGKGGEGRSGGGMRYERGRERVEMKGMDGREK